jgi:hypothetical protein
MTSRVFDCHAESDLLSFAWRAAGGRIEHRGWLAASLSAIVLVPIAGAADQPDGWLSAAFGALAVLGLHRASRGHAPWGPLVWLVALVALVVPRTSLPPVGPALFVTAGLSAVLWLCNRSTRDADDDRPQRGSPEREAQQAMGRHGEQHVRFALKRELPDEFVLINGLLVPRAAGDIDHVVVGPTGVFLLETKTMAGHITCAPDGSWQRTKLGRRGTPYPAFIGDPAAQAQRNILALRDCLRDRVPGLFQGVPLWVEGLLVFAHPGSAISAEHSRVAAVRLDETTQRITQHQPRRRLDAHEVDRVVGALLSASRERGQVAALGAQALVETALALPVVLALLFGTLALSRMVQAHTAVVGLAHEVARAGALGATPADAVERMHLRAHQLEVDLGLRHEALAVQADASAFARESGRVRASANYRVELGDLPLVGWLAPEMNVHAEHVEWVDPFRSGVGAPDRMRR